MTNEQMRLELSKFSVAQATHDEQIRNNTLNEIHHKFTQKHLILQKYIWVGTVILLALGIIFK